MLLKYIFPVPLQGKMKLVPLYVRAETYPLKNELLDLLLSLLHSAKKERNWNEVKNYTGCLDALRSIEELPILHADHITVFECDTAIGKSVIQASIIKEHVIHPMIVNEDRL